MEIENFSKKLGLEFVAEGRGDLESTFGPEDVFHYIYAVLHSPTYRERYADFLKIDFPRVPLTAEKALVASLAALGRELCALHLMEFEVESDLRARSDEADGPAVRPYLSETSFPVAGDNEVAKGFPKFVSVDEASSLVQQNKNALAEQTRQDASSTLGRVYISKTQYFDGVPSRVWNFTIGGYQVCEKWLKDRRGRTLLLDDVRHYQKIVVALHCTDELDRTIPQWPIQ